MSLGVEVTGMCLGVGCVDETPRGKGPSASPKSSRPESNGSGQTVCGRWRQPANDGSRIELVGRNNLRP
jgi:hypothetical protein